MKHGNRKLIALGGCLLTAVLFALVGIEAEVPYHTLVLLLTAFAGGNGVEHIAGAVRALGARRRTEKGDC